MASSVRMRFPLVYQVRPPERMSRLLALVRLPLLLPWMVVGVLVSVVGFAGYVLTWFAIILAGRVPESLFTVMAALLRWQAKYLAFYYLLSDSYDVLGFGENPNDEVTLSVPRPERSSRILAIVRPIMLLPGFLVFMFVSLASLLLLPVSWVAVIALGRHPEWLFLFHEGMIRWDLRLLAYSYMLRDEYPPYSKDENAPISSNLAQFILGITLIGFILVLFSAGGRGSQGFFESDEERREREEEEEELLRRQEEEAQQRRGR